MVRRPRIVVEGGLYHVYNRVSRGEAIFADPNEAIDFVEMVRDVKKRDGWTVLAWCLMSNHFHLVLRTSSVPLWRGMHGIQNSFSRGFNRRYRRTGAVWQSRYKARYIEEQSYLDRLVVYVHLNAVKAGVVEDPAEYLFSGHREVKKRIRSPLIDIDEMLLCFGGTKKAARQSYLRAIRIGMDPDVPERAPTWHPFKLLRDQPLELKRGAPYVDVQGRSTGLERPPLPADEFVRRACEIAGLDPERLASRARDRTTARNRRLIVTLGAERWKQKRTELAKVLKKNPDVVSWWVGEGVRRRMEDGGFAAQLDDIDRELSDALTTVSGREDVS